MSAFSRLQLAAALLEYDNDPSNPDAPYRSAQESAIFAHLRRHTALKERNASRKSDYLGVSLPSDSGSLGGRESTLDHRKSRSSIEALRNPFGGDETVDDEYERESEHNVEVDLASWGLDAFLPKEKDSKSARSAGKQKALPNPHPVSPSLREYQVSGDSLHRRSSGARSLSVGNIDAYASNFASSSSVHGIRRGRSIGSALDLAGMEPAPISSQRRPSSSYGLVETVPETAPMHSIPFPTSSPRSLSPAGQTSRLHDRNHSTGSMGSRLLDEADQNPFSVEPPPPDRASRFDPKAERNRTMSQGTMASRGMLVDENPGPLRPLSRSSRLDERDPVHARTMSNGSMGTRHLLENDGRSVMTGRERPYSTFEMLRPKVLVMPSPLQSVMPVVRPQPVGPRDGFEISTDGPPLPPGAKAPRRSSLVLSVTDPSSFPAPVASNSFTPNPRMSMSLSQLTFRNTLMVGGERDVAYNDLNEAIPRATEDGQQIESEVPEEIPLEVIPEPVTVEEPVPQGRLAGKLYGKSLIDDLEMRKAQMRSKQRVFTGDERPSMMARGQQQRSSTLIDPASLQNQLQTRPTSQHMNSFGSSSQQPLARRNSANVKPLLNFDDDIKGATVLATADVKIPKSRSVFGVDTIWERDLVKLQAIEAQEKLEAEERRILEEKAEAKVRKKGKGKDKKKGKSKKEDVEQLSADPTPASQSFSDLASRVSAEPPTLPAIPKASARRRPPPIEGDESESDESAAVGPSGSLAARTSTDAQAVKWIGSSDEEHEVPRRTTGTGPRYLKVSMSRPRPPDDDSEEDLPLAASLGRVRKRAAQVESDDEEKPLSVLLEKTKLSLPNLNSYPHTSTKPSNHDPEGDDEDEVPLGLRASKAFASNRAFSTQVGEADEDDMPLAYHPEQQRRTQYLMLAQQQQQMLMQAQLQSSMFFGGTPSMMGPGFFGPQMPMMAPPMPMLPSPPSHDSVKYGRVDRWRRDVAVDSTES